MRNRWRTGGLVAAGVCALVLLPIAINVATSGTLPAFIRNPWVSWAMVMTFGIVAVVISLRSVQEPAPAAPPLPPAADDIADRSELPDPPAPPETIPETGDDYRETAEAGESPAENGSAEPKQATPLETMPVRVESLPARVVGRDSLLNKLQKLRDSGGLAVLVGPGGIGKSTVACELVRRTDPPGAARPAWEVSAAGAQSLMEGLRAVAANLGADPAELAAIGGGEPSGPDIFWRLLEPAPPGWVLIVDNADEPGFLARPPGIGDDPPRLVADGTGWVRPTSRGLVVVTSRQGSRLTWPADAWVQELDRLPRRAAAQMLRALAPRAGDLHQAGELAERLGRLPLALRLAGLYLGSGFAEHGSFDVYRRALESDPRVLRYLELHADDPPTANRANRPRAPSWPSSATRSPRSARTTRSPSTPERITPRHWPTTVTWPVPWACCGRSSPTPSPRWERKTSSSSPSVTTWPGC